jgi:2-C-methyl-D-erythritol 4-phosphate cytidylyltransferase
MGNKGSIAAVVPAAGIGSRMQTNGVPKQYLQLHGTTVLEYSLRAMCGDPRIGEVFLALAADDHYFAELALSQINGVVITPVFGGANRAQSVLAGVQRAQQQGYQWVAVHDAARPCLLASELSAVLDAGISHPAGALLGLPCSDTMKRVDPQLQVVTNVDREQLWHALTPQVFATDLLLHALLQQDLDDPGLTDEAAAVQALGRAPQMVMGQRSNLKITQPGDEYIAAAILAARSS